MFANMRPRYHTAVYLVNHVYHIFRITYFTRGIPSSLEPLNSVASRFFLLTPVIYVCTMSTMYSLTDERSVMVSEHQVTKSTRLPKGVVDRIDKLTAPVGSTVSQFLRTAAMKELRRLEKARG